MTIYEKIGIFLTASVLEVFAVIILLSRRYLSNHGNQRALVSLLFLIIFYAVLYYQITILRGNVENIEVTFISEISLMAISGIIIVMMKLPGNGN